MMTMMMVITERVFARDVHLVVRQLEIAVVGLQ